MVGVATWVITEDHSSLVHCKFSGSTLKIKMAGHHLNVLFSIWIPFSYSKDKEFLKKYTKTQCPGFSFCKLLKFHFLE